MFGYLKYLFLNKHIYSISANAAQTAEPTILWWQETHTNDTAAAGTGTPAASPR